MPIAAKPIKANAVIGEIIAAGVFYAIATAALHLGIHIATSDEAQQAVADFFYQCTDSVKENFQIAASGAGLGYYIYYEWSKEAWSECAHAISEWFTVDRYGSSSEITFGQVTVTNDSINLSEEDSFFLNIPKLSDSYQEIHYRLNQCEFVLYVNCPSWRLNELTWGTVNENHSATANTGTYFAIQVDDLDLYFFGDSTISIDSEAVYSNHAFSQWFNNWGDYYYYANMYNIYNTQHGFSFLSRDGYFVTNDGSGRRFKLGATEQGYCFRSSESGVYNDLYFDSYESCLNWFLNRAGLSLNTSVPYTPSAVVSDDDIQIDADTVNQRLQEIDDMSNTDTVDIVLPGTEEQYQELLDNPSRVTDITSNIIYGGDINIPVISNVDAWKTKFPLCIPFDIIRLFSGFSATAECPKFHILVMPSNSFGLTNDDIYWDLDFSDYNYLVQMLRFFIAISFVVWLIMITKKVIS